MIVVGIVSVVVCVLWGVRRFADSVADEPGEWFNW